MRENRLEHSALAAVRRRGSGLRDQLAQYVRQDAAVLVVIELDRRIYAQLHRDLFSGPVRAAYDQRDVLLRPDPAVETDYVESFRAVEVEGLRADAFFELQRQHAHSDQVATVNPLEALGDDRSHAQQPRPLRRPIARAARAVLLAGDHDQRRPFGLILHRRVIDAHLLASRIMFRHAAFHAGDHQVLDAHVGEGAARHDAVVAATRAVTVEVGHIDVSSDQVLPRRRGRFDRTCGTDVIGGHRIAEYAERTRADDVRNDAWLHAEILEERRLLNVCGTIIPFVNVSG